jgi:PAS domain S-box-containing protein
MSTDNGESGESTERTPSGTGQDASSEIGNRLRELQQQNERLRRKIRHLEQDSAGSGDNAPLEDEPTDSLQVFRTVYKPLETPSFLLDVENDSNGPNFTFLDMNRSFEDLLHRDREDALAMDPLSLFNKQDRAHVKTQSRRSTRDNRRIVFHANLKQETDDDRFETSLIPFTHDGQVEAIFGLMEHVSPEGEYPGRERKERPSGEPSGEGMERMDAQGGITFAKQRRSERSVSETDGSIDPFPDVPQSDEHQQFLEKSKAIEHSPIGIVMTDPNRDNAVCYMNDAFAQLTGYSREEVIGRNCRFLQGDETDPEVVDRIRTAIDSEEPITVEIRNYRKNGEMFWNQLMITPIRDESGEVYRYLGYQRDVTQRKTYEQELELFRETMERGPDSIFIVDPDTATFIDVNRTAVQKHGYTREQLKEMGPREVNPHFGEDLNWSDHLEELQDHGPLTVESEHRTEDGTLFPVEVHVNHIELEGQARVVAIARDITERERARTKIERQANFLQMINDQLPGVTYQMRTAGEDDPPFEFTYLSKGFDELAGVPSEGVEEEAERLTSIIHPEDRYSLGEALVTSQQELTPLRHEFRIDHRERGERWLQARAKPEKQGDGQVIWTGVMMDVTEKRRNLSRRKEQERRFRTLFENAPIALWEEDWSGARERIQELVPEDVDDLVSYLEDHPDVFRAIGEEISIVLPNKTAVQMTRADDKKHLHENFMEIVTEETHEAVRADLAALWNGDMNCSSRTTFKRFDGDRRIILRDVQRVPGYEDWSRVFVSYRDVTESERRKEELEATRAREERFRKLAENVGGVFWQYDSSTGEYLYLSSHCERVFGVTKEELYDDPSSFLQKVHPEDRDRVDELIHVKRNEGYDETYRMQIDGEWRWVRDRAYPVREDGEVTLTAGIAEDITEQVKQQKRLKEQVAETERISELKSDFVARTTHDLRTPLNSIIGMADLLASTDLTPDQRDYLRTIRSTGQTMLHITNDILDLDRVENGTLELMDQPFALRSLIKEVGKLFHPWIRDEAIELDTNVDDDVPDRVIGDPNRLKQILVNLIGNAVKFTEEGRVSVSISRESTSGQEVVVRVEVEDTGPGIPEDQQKEIFEERTSDGSKGYHIQPGAGLGLSVCQTLVERMGGDIWLDSQEGKGSTFSFTIKLERQEQDRIDERTEDRGLDNTCVLIADDNRLLRRTFQVQLSDGGAHVCQAQDTEEARAILMDREQPKPDVAFIDQRMDERTGTDLVQEMAEASRGPSARRMYILTGDDRTTIEEELTESDFAGVLQKPATGEDIRDAARAVVDELGRRSDVPDSDHAISDALKEQQLQVLLVEDDLQSQAVMKEYLEPVVEELQVLQYGAGAVDERFNTAPDLILMDLELPDREGIDVLRDIRREEAGRETGRVPVIVQTALAINQVRDDVMEAGADTFLEKPFTREELYRAMTSVLDGS